jgi:hypothetical protein
MGIGPSRLNHGWTISLAVMGTPEGTETSHRNTSTRGDGLPYSAAVNKYSDKLQH